jgi:hypothetical protein
VCERDIRFEQRAAHFAQRHVHIGFAQHAAPRQTVAGEPNA